MARTWPLFIYLLVIGIGCGTTPSLAEGSISSASLVDKVGVLEWQGREEGLPPTPSWLMPLFLGDGSEYCKYKKLDNASDDQWVAVSFRAISLDLARKGANNGLSESLGTSIATSILGTIGSLLNTGDKDTVRGICLSMDNASVNLKGLEMGGEMWRKVGIEGNQGYMNISYDYYIFYHCTRDVYNELMNVYLVNIVKTPDIGENIKQVLLTNAQTILNDAYTRVPPHRELVLEQNLRELKEWYQEFPITYSIGSKEATAPVESVTKSLIESNTGEEDKTYHISPSLSILLNE